MSIHSCRMRSVRVRLICLPSESCLIPSFLERVEKIFSNESICMLIREKKSCIESLLKSIVTLFRKNSSLEEKLHD